MRTRIKEELFLELGELLNSNLDEVSVLRTFCNRILSLFDAERVSILAMDPFGKHLTLTAWAGRYPENIQGLKIPVGEGVAGWVAATGEALLVRDIEEDARFADRLEDRYKTRSFISVPLKSRGRILGVLNVTDTTRNVVFTENNLNTLRTLGLQVGMGMENMHLRDRMNFLYSATSAFIPTLHDLQSGPIDIEAGLIPSTIKGLINIMGPHSHLLLIGEMSSNRAWIGRSTGETTTEISVMDFRSGFSLYQSLVALPVNPPFVDNPTLIEPNFPWDMIRERKLRLVRSMLPPRHHIFGIVLSAIPERAPEAMELLRGSQNIIIQFSSLLMEGVFDRLQIQRLDQLKTELISTVSHELRTPLTSIQGFSELILRDEDISEAHIRSLGIINNESKRLNRLINNFLDLARLESGQKTLIKEPIDSTELVERAVKLLKPQAEAARASVRLHCDHNLPPLIADEDRIEQTLVNLVGNAIKYGGQGVHIDIHVHTSGEQTIFDIIDDGVGISSDELPLVFNRFYRGGRESEVTDDEAKGIGLGLSLTKEIIEQHGGSITVESIPGERTAFMFNLPSQGLISPRQHITAWHPGDEEFPSELANRLTEGKTVGLLTVHVNPIEDEAATEDLTVEAIGDIEDLIISTLKISGMEDDFIQSRPQGEFLILTYASLVDTYADRLAEAFEGHFKDKYILAIGAAVTSQDEEWEADKLFTLSQQACLYVERTTGTGYLKNRRT